MRGHSQCLAGVLWPYLGTLLGREPSALCRTSHLTCKSQLQEESKRGGGCAAWGKFQVKHDKRFQICRRETAVLGLPSPPWAGRGVGSKGVRFRLNFRKIAVVAAVKHQNVLIRVTAEFLPLNLGTEEDGLARAAGLCLSGLTSSCFACLLSPLGACQGFSCNFLLPSTQLVLLAVLSLHRDHTNLTLLLCNGFVSITKIPGFRCKVSGTCI